MDITIGLAVVIFGGTLFYLGSRYGRAAEQYVVAKALTTYRQRYAAASTEIGHILSTLKADYTEAYFDASADYEKIKKAL